MIIFLFGTDGYRVKENVETIVGAYHKKHKSGVNFYRLDLSVDGGFDELSNATKSVSFFDEVKFAVVKNAFSSNISSRIISLINELDIGKDKKTVLLFAENKNKKELQMANKELFGVLGHKDNLIKEVEPLGGVKLSNWVKNKFKDNGHDISSPVANSLISMVGNDSWALANEIQKLSNYIRGIRMSFVDSDYVHLLVSKKEDGKIFDLVDAVGNQNRSKAFELMYRLTNSGVDGHYLLSMLVYHLENLLSVYDGSTPKYLHPFVAKKAASQARRFTKEGLLSKFNYLAELDVASKNGQVNLEDALYNFVIS